jgi:antitoxin (DNA-binding transcriptional repressor) of toxin-antitoxin stability system
MATIRLTESNVQEFLARIRAGEKLTIADEQDALAEVVPIPKRKPEEVRRLIAQWRHRTKDWSLQGLKVKDLISEGRR